MKWIIGEPSQENVKKMYIPIPTEKNMKWIIGEPSQENVYTYSYSYWEKKWNGSLVNPVKKMYIPIPTEIKYEMDHWWTQSRKMYIPIPTEKKVNPWNGSEKNMKWIIGEPSQENVYTYSYWNKIWNGSLVNPVKKMYIPIPTEIKYEMDHWWTQSRKCIYLFLLK